MVEFVESKKFKPLDGIAIVILFITLVITGSRGGSFAFLASIISLTVIYRNFKNHKKTMLAIVFSLAIAITVFFMYNPSLLNRYAHIDNLDRYSSNRIPIWQEGIRHWQLKPFAGYGFDVYPDLQNSNGVKTAHNIFIQALVEGGVIAFLLLLFGVIPMVGYKTTDSFSRAAKAGVIGIFVTSLFLFTLNYDYFWLAMMLGEISSRATLKKKVQQKELLPVKRSTRLSLDVR
jgi:O-antigen ligase